MRLLFLCKRCPQGKDLLTHPYGRFYYLPKVLANYGHEIHILLLSYKNEPKLALLKDGIHWTSLSLKKNGPSGYIREAKKIIGEIHPDWIVGFSDTYYGILAQHLARRFGCRSLIDAYDNYESYMPWCKPLHYLWRRALSKADLVTAAGPQLAELMGQNRPNKPTVVVPMTADPTDFKPLDKKKCRQELGLPTDKKLVGYCGSIHSSRGIDVLFAAYKILLREHKEIELVLSGRKGAGVHLPDGTRWLGYLPDEKMPGLLNSMDVLTVLNKSSAFGNYSYPIKLYEAMCCQVPVVASATLAAKWILADFPDLLVEADDSNLLAKAIGRAMHHEKIDYGQRQGWERGADILQEAMGIG